jgi:hypothetical protein
MDPLDDPWKVTPALRCYAFYRGTRFFNRLEAHEMVDEEIRKHHDMESRQILSLEMF